MGQCSTREIPCEKTLALSEAYDVRLIVMTGATAWTSPRSRIADLIFLVPTYNFIRLMFYQPRVAHLKGCEASAKNHEEVR